MSGFEYKAFITYSHKDSKAASRLQRSLESHRVPARLIGKDSPQGKIEARVGAIFRDREDLSAGVDLSQSINTALLKSEYLIVICSPAARASRWVNLEICEFRKIHGDDKILCYVIDGKPFAASSGYAHNLECFPPALGYIESDGEARASTEPIAADCRAGADGRRLATLKIISGLLGIRLDELIQRDAQRRTWRMAAVASGSLAIAAFTLLLALVAFNARNEADQQRDQAESLLSFMVVDLRSSLEPLGRLDLLEQVGNQAMDYFASVERNDLTQLGVLRQIEVLTQIGQIRLAQLLNTEALASFKSAYERGLQLTEDNPTDEESLFQRSQSEYWIGTSHWQDGNLEQATKWWTKYRDSGIELSKLDPVNATWRRELGYGFHNLGVLAIRNRQFELADKYFNEELDILLQLSSADSENSSYRYDLGDTASWLGRNAYQQGRLTTAEEYYQQSLSFLGELLDSDPDNANFQYWMANAYMLSYKMSLSIGNVELASQQLQRAIGILDSLVERDAANGEWRLARYRATTHEVEMDMIGAFDSEQLLDELDSVIRGLDSLEGEGIVASVIEERQIRPHRLRSAIAAAQGLQEQAISQLQAVLPDPQQALPNDENIIAELAKSWILISDINRALNRANAANTAWQNASSVLATIASDSGSPNILAPWAELLDRLGDNESSLAVKNQLTSIGYFFLGT